MDEAQGSSSGSMVPMVTPDAAGRQVVQAEFDPLSHMPDRFQHHPAR